jgi:hypothetical protein
MVRFTVTRPKERIDVVNNGVCHTEGLESFADRRLSYKNYWPNSVDVYAKGGLPIQLLSSVTTGSLNSK